MAFFRFTQLGWLRPEIKFWAHRPMHDALAAGDVFSDEMAELLGHCASTALGFPRAVCLSRPPLSCWLSAASSMRLTMRSADSPLLCSPHADIMLTHRSPQTTRLRKGRTPRSGQVITVRTVT